ncbi:MAG: hypothetical protein KKD05_00825 [Candidatus Omnitrophica bacterium]|nr:hypothetical protein [Candidatus Omnitrophota bacterium]
MKKLLLIFMISALFLGGCKTTARIPMLKNSLTPKAVIELWGNPLEKIQAGSTPKNYPVELWKYSFKKGHSLSGKPEEWVLIFVDSELYLCTEDNPDKIFQELLNLGVFDDEEITLLENQESLQNAATKAEENRRTMDIIRTYQFYQNTQMQIQTQQLLQTLRQQPVYIPPPAPPAKQIRQ